MEKEYSCDICDRPMDFIDAQFGSLCRQCRDIEEQETLRLTGEYMRKLEAQKKHE